MLFNYLYFDPKQFGTPIAFKDNKKLKNLKSDYMFQTIKTQFFKKYTKNPFFYFCGTHDISDLECFMKYEKYNHIVKNQKIDFFFFEPLTHYLPSSSLSYRPHILKSNNSLYDRKNIRCYELDSISEWVDKHNIKHLKVYCTDYGSEEYYKDVYPNLKLKFMDVFAVAMFNNKIDTADEIDRRAYTSDTIEKKLIAPAWRYDASRHFIMAFLAEKNLIQGNNISFLYNVDEQEMIKSMWFNLHEFKFKYPDFANTLISGNKKLKNMVPLTIDVENPIAIYGTKNFSPEGHNIVNSHNFLNEYRESFLSIVMESRVTQPWPNISEKTINAIFNDRPFVMVGAPGVLKFLKDIGFKTFSDYWDESYDDILFHDDRLVKVCNTIESICSMSIDQMKLMYNDMIPILKHNREHIKTINQFYKKYKLNK
jgi:hypothetical protein